MGNSFTIGQMADLSGVSIDTIRYYEKIQLLPSPKRKNNSHRYYSDEDRERLRLIICLKKAGLSLEDIRIFLSMPFKEEFRNVPELHSMLLEHKENIERQLKSLQQILSMIDAKLAGDKLEI